MEFKQAWIWLLEVSFGYCMLTMFKKCSFFSTRKTLKRSNLNSMFSSKFAQTLSHKPQLQLKWMFLANLLVSRDPDAFYVLHPSE